MNFDYTNKVKTLQARLIAFMDEHIYPNEKRFFQEIAENRAKGNAWIPTKLIEELKPSGARLLCGKNKFHKPALRARGLSSSMSLVGTQALPLARLSAISWKKRFSFG